LPWFQPSSMARRKVAMLASVTETLETAMGSAPYYTIAIVGTEVIL
jgi:hypothetical protein